MSTLLLKISEGCEEPYVEFYVDGEDLGTVEAALGEAGFDDVLPWYGGDYAIEDTVLGEAAQRNGAERAIIFACGCGFYTCSGVFAEVVISGDTLILSEFSTWRGGQKVVAPISPIVFDRRQYDDAVRRLHDEVKAWRPPPQSRKATQGALDPTASAGVGARGRTARGMV